MFWQLDADHGMLAGYLTAEPNERKDRNGKRMIVLEVAFDCIRKPCADGHRHVTNIKMPVVVFGEYTSKARLMSKGDGVLCVGERPLEPPRGYTTNPMMIDKRRFGVLLGTESTKTWMEELAAYERNEAVKTLNAAAKKKRKKTPANDNDNFSEIDGDQW